MGEIGAVGATVDAKDDISNDHVEKPKELVV